MPIKAVLFDLDDTLVARAETFALYCRRLVREMSIPEQQRLPAIEYLLAADKNGYADRFGLFRQFVEEWKLPQTPGYLVEKWFEEFGGEAIPKEGLTETLAYLRFKYKLAIVTNGTTAMQNRKIDALGIRGYFEAIVVSEDIGYRKPDERIYIAACQALGVGVTEAVFVGDNEQLDVAGPRRIGMRAIWFSSGGREPNDEAKITALADLRAML